MMGSKIDYKNHPDNYNCQPWWWHGGGHGSATTTTTDMSEEDKANWAWPKGFVDSGPGPKTNTKEMQITLSPPGGGESPTPHKNRDASTVLPLMSDEHHVSTFQSELLSLSMTAGTSYQYHDACYEGLMPPFGFQTWNSEYGRMAQGRMVLPLDMAEEPVYVNVKQYHGILRRRQSRAKAEVENRIIRSQRKPYLHESRHLHATRRERGCGGRFVSKKKKAEPRASMDDDGEGSNISLGSKSMSNDRSCYEGSQLHLSAHI